MANLPMPVAQLLAATGHSQSDRSRDSALKQNRQAISSKAAVLKLHCRVFQESLRIRNRSGSGAFPLVLHNAFRTSPGVVCLDQMILPVDTSNARTASLRGVATSE